MEGIPKKDDLTFIRIQGLGILVKNVKFMATQPTLPRNVPPLGGNQSLMRPDHEAGHF